MMSRTTAGVHAHRFRLARPTATTSTSRAISSACTAGRPVASWLLLESRPRSDAPRAAAKRPLLLPLQRRLRRGEARDRHAERAARHVIQPDPVAELHAVRVAAVLAADADLQV